MKDLHLIDIIIYIIFHNLQISDTVLLVLVELRHLSPFDSYNEASNVIPT